MADEQAGQARRIIKRTVTITTSEMWTVTIGPTTEVANRPTESGAVQDIIDQAIDRISQANQEEQP